MTHEQRDFIKHCLLATVLLITLLLAQRPLYKLMIKTVGTYNCTFTEADGKQTNYYWVGAHSYELR